MDKETWSVKSTSSSTRCVRVRVSAENEREDSRRWTHHTAVLAARPYPCVAQDWVLVSHRNVQHLYPVDAHQPRRRCLCFLAVLTRSLTVQHLLHQPLGSTTVSCCRLCHQATVG